MSSAPDLTLHDMTRRVCEAYVQSPHTGLILHGNLGVGLGTIAQAIGTALNSHPEATVIIKPEDGKNISIDQIRELYHQTRTKRRHHLTIIVDDADTMGVPAQNAFLKLLEEPPENVVFILTTHAPTLLLPTIQSRVAMIEVHPVSEQQSREVILGLGVDDATKTTQLLFLARGNVAHITRLVRDEDEFLRRSEMIKTARQVIQGSSYQRLITLKEAMSDRVQAIDLMRTMGEMIAFGMQRNTSVATARQLHLITMTIEKLETNANVRLQLVSLALSL